MFYFSSTILLLSAFQMMPLDSTLESKFNTQAKVATDLWNIGEE